MAECVRCEGSGVCQGHINGYSRAGYPVGNNRESLDREMATHNNWQMGQWESRVDPANVPCATCNNDDDKCPGSVECDCYEMPWSFDRGEECMNCNPGKRFPGTDVTLGHGMQTCDECGGFGCADGDGNPECDNGIANCDECGGKGYFPCENGCDDGYVNCANCWGSGQIACDDCNGDLNCSRCRGTGEI